MKFLCSTSAILLLLVATIAVAAQRPDLSQFDLSTRAGVNAAREAIAGRKLDDHSRNCVSLDQKLPGIAIVGSFAFDYGCRFSGVFIKSHYFENDAPGLSQAALKALGWKSAKPKQREELATNWVQNGLLTFLTVLSAKNADFAERSFEPPHATSAANGETIVTLWIRMPPGRRRGRSYQQREFKFAADGALLSALTRESFSTATGDE
jgi:hypothetical protein